MAKVSVDAEKLKYLAQEMCRVGEEILGKCEASLAKEDEDSEEDDTEDMAEEETKTKPAKSKMMMAFLKTGKKK